MGEIKRKALKAQRIWYRYEELDSKRRAFADRLMAQVHLDLYTAAGFWDHEAPLKYAVYKFGPTADGGVRCIVRRQAHPFTELDLYQDELLADEDDGARTIIIEEEDLDSQVIEIEITEFGKPVLYSREETGEDQDIWASFSTTFYGLERTLLGVVLSGGFEELPFSRILQILRANPQLVVRTNSRQFLQWAGDCLDEIRRRPPGLGAAGTSC